GEEADVGGVREQGRAFDLGADQVEVEVGELDRVDEDRALRVADRDVLELPLAARRADRAAPPGAAGGEVLRGGGGVAHVDRAGQLAGDRRADRPGDGRDRELVVVGPAVAAQVEDTPTA